MRTKGIIVALFFVFAGHSVWAKLSLADKKGIASQEKYVTEDKARIKEACGCVPQVAINWAGLKKVKDNELGSFKGNGASCFNGFADVAKNICEDGNKAEFCAGVKKVVINATDGKEAKDTAKAGTVTMISASNGCGGTSDLQRIIEEAL